MHFLVNSNIAEKGALGGLKCKRHCFMPKYQYEFIDQTDHDTNPTGTGNRNGGSGQAHTFGFNHYFNSNVRLMAEYTHGDYASNNDNGMKFNYAVITSKITSKILEVFLPDVIQGSSAPLFFY